MGTISVNQENELFWLGRYTERVYTTLGKYAKYFDSMIDTDSIYQSFCQRMEIPDIYQSNEDFLQRYGYDESNPDSLISNLQRGYNNAVILREVIGSGALSYIQLAVYAIRKAAVSEAPVLELQKVRDNILAFWGSCDDSIFEAVVRDFIKTGRRLERVDLYARMHYPEARMKEAIKRLIGYRLVRSGAGIDQEKLSFLEKCSDPEVKDMDYDRIIEAAEGLFTQ
ncbi:MAG: alpha-E domain-containing protein [Eubacterium sp.]|nr:alpha-E domain-containing protein [Eubacterium sp.]